MLHRVFILLPLLAALAAAPARGEEPLFPFVVSYEPSDGLTNVSAWLARPAGRDGFVRADKGRLATGAGPMRFFATNLCFEACFPSHAEADRLADRLAGLGINCVRMHHMDSHSIWGDSPSKLTIDPKKLERLDYLVAALRERGIYTNLNLHVSRWFGEAEGFSGREDRPNYDKGLDNFEPRMIELQKKYARDLLTHTNPYTGKPYSQEPAVGFVEISNEDALYAEWSWGHLDTLPEPYAGTFRKLWNAWLRKKYGGTEKLREAWDAREWPPGEEMLTDGRFARPLGEAWHLERDEQTRVTWSVPPEGPEGRACLRLDVERNGAVPWRPQMSQAGLAVRKGTPYTLTCWLRSDAPRRIGLNCMMAHEPWERLGFSAEAAIDSQWKEHHFTFFADRDDSNARITFTELRPGRYELADVSLRPGGVLGPKPDERLEDDRVPLLTSGQSTLGQAARRDFADFLWDTERDYWWGMYRFLKDELGVQSLVAGTQLGYSPVHVQAGLDYIDAHSYWQHPAFPGRPWDPNNWTIENVALVNSPGGTLAGLAVRRVDHRPFTVSEYNHPAPNVYAAEGLPMLSAFAALQAWDGIYSFTYSHNTEYELRRIPSFFDIKSDPAKLVHLPACAAMFLRGDVAPAKQLVAAPLSRDAQREKLRETLSAWTLTAQQLGVDPRLSLVHRVAMDLQEGPAASSPEPGPATLPADMPLLVSDTGQVRWDVTEKRAGCFLVDSPRTKLFTGFVRGRTFSLGDVTLKIGPTRLDWATVSMTVVEGEGFDEPGRILLAATGWVQNTGAELQDLGGNRVTLGNRWGTEPVLCEGVPAEILLPVAAERVNVFALDESGRRGTPLACTSRDGKAQVLLGPQYKTLWYEIQVR